MKKSLLVTTLILTAPFSASAKDEMTVKLSGHIDTMSGFVDQKDFFQTIYDDSNVATGKRHNFAIVNDTKVSIKVEAKSDKGFKYGGRIRMNADTSQGTNGTNSVIADKTMLFIESSKLGRLEAGAYNSASNEMNVNAATIATGTGGIDGKLLNWLGSGPTVNGLSNRYINAPSLPIDCDCVSYTNKLTYFTPKIYGFQAGLSFSPDTQIHGTTAKYNTINKNADSDFKNIYNYALKYEKTIGKIEYIVGLTGEVAEAKKGEAARNRKNLNIWQLGAIIKYQGFSVAGSFSDWGKSATPVAKDANKKYGANFWTAGLGYEQGNWKTSLTYMESKRANVFTGRAPAVTADHDTKANKLKFAVLGVDYTLAPGFVPHAEFARVVQKDSARKGNKASVLLIGSKLSF